MTAPIKTCDYCGATGEMPTFMNGETICYTCMSVLPKTLPEARQELMRLRAVLAVGAQPAPSVPDGWLRAIDEALVTAHIGVANAHDTYEQAKAKLDNLIGFLVDVATDPAVNGGWKLVPIEPTSEMLRAGEDTFVTTYTGTPVSAPIDVTGDQAMTKTMYEINWHYKDSDQNQFSHCTVTPITVIRESVLPGCTAVSITAKDSEGRTFIGSPEGYFETEAAAWAAAKQDLLDTIESHDKTVMEIKEEIHRLFSFLITLL